MIEGVVTYLIARDADEKTLEEADVDLKRIMPPPLQEYLIRKHFGLTHQEFLTEEYLSVKEQLAVMRGIHKYKLKILDDASKPPTGEKGADPFAYICYAVRLLANLETL